MIEKRGVTINVPEPDEPDVEFTADFLDSLTTKVASRLDNGNNNQPKPVVPVTRRFDKTESVS